MRRSISVGLVAIALAFGAANTASADPFSDGYAAYERADYPVALRIWEPLAKKGNCAAQSLLGDMHYYGHGVPQNYTEAAKWYRLAAEQGQAEAQFNLGMMHDQGQGVPQNYAEAAKWFRLAADQGLAAAQFNLGVMHYKGEGVPQNYVLAHMWLNLAGAGSARGASTNRDNVASKMTPAQIAEAQRLAASWKPK
jgi:TPR repeat protein